MKALRVDPAARARKRELLEQEIALVEGQLKEVRKKVELGVVPTLEPVAKQRESLHLQRKLAELEVTPANTAGVARRRLVFFRA